LSKGNTIEAEFILGLSFKEMRNGDGQCEGCALTQLVPGANKASSKRLVFIYACDDDELSSSGQFV